MLHFRALFKIADASFQNIGASSGNGVFLNIVNDVSFQRSIRGTDASFQNIGASDGNAGIVKIVNDGNAFRVLFMVPMRRFRILVRLMVFY